MFFRVILILHCDELLVLHLRGSFKQRKNILQGGNEKPIFVNDIGESRLRFINSRRKRRSNSARRRKQTVLLCSSLVHCANKLPNFEMHGGSDHEIIYTVTLIHGYSARVKTHTQWSNFRYRARNKASRLMWAKMRLSST
jgi:hypothetical protein